MTKRPWTCGATDGCAEERGVPGGSSAILVGSRARVVTPSDRERQQVSLARTVVVLDQTAAKPGVEAFELQKDLVRSDGARLEGSGQRDDQRRLRVLSRQRLGSAPGPSPRSSRSDGRPGGRDHKPPAAVGLEGRSVAVLSELSHQCSLVLWWWLRGWGRSAPAAVGRSGARGRSDRLRYAQASSRFARTVRWHC